MLWYILIYYNYVLLLQLCISINLYNVCIYSYYKTVHVGGVFLYMQPGLEVE